MISLWVYSLLPLLLFFFVIRLLPEQHEDVNVFTTGAILLTATCSWFCTILLEFSSMFLCKISFSSSSNARLPFSILKENKTLYLESANGRCSVKKMFFCHVSMMWTLVDLFCSKKLFPQKNAFFPRLFYRRWERKEFVLLGIQLFFCNKWIQNCDSLQDTQLFDRAPQGTGQL